MTAISSTTGFQATTQSAFQQMKVQQARQNADRAEQAARALSEKASEAQRVADRAQDDARTLSVESGQAQRVAGRARQGLAMMSSVSQMGAQLGRAAERVAERQEVVSEEPVAATSTASTAGGNTAVSSAPVRNLSGQVIGGTVNTTA